jgi:hypothetical protein
LRPPQVAFGELAQTQSLYCLPSARSSQQLARRVDVLARLIFLTHFSLGENMRASFLAVCGTAVIMLVSALAETKTTPRLHPESLARIEAITSFCEKVDRASQADYRLKLNDFVSGHSSDELVADRASNRYQKAMVQANETLASVSPATEVKSCGQFLAENY